MSNVFEKKSAKELQVELPDGRMMPLEELVREYVRLFNEEYLKMVDTSEPKKDKSTVSKLKVGKWFLIDRAVIHSQKEEIHRKCKAAGNKGEELWLRFEKSNKIAAENPYQYPRVIRTYIFEHDWEYKIEQKMRDMCEELCDGMCDEIICDLELQMRICNGELVDDLVNKADKLPRVRIIKTRSGNTGFFGGGAVCNKHNPPACIIIDTYDFAPLRVFHTSTPYAFRRELS